MPFIPAPATTIRAVHNFEVQSELCLCVFHFDVGAVAPSPAELLAFANDLMGAWDATLSTNQSDETFLTKVVCTDVTAPGGVQVESSSAPVQGGAAQVAANNALAFLIQLNTPFSGRSNRGRMFVPGMRADSIDTDSNYWEPALVSGGPTAMQELAEDWLAAVEALTPVGATTAALCIASYYSGTYTDENPPPPGSTARIGDPIPREEAVTTGVTSVTARRRIATQRRRRPRS